MILTRIFLAIYALVNIGALLSMMGKQKKNLKTIESCLSPLIMMSVVNTVGVLCNDYSLGITIVYVVLTCFSIVVVIPKFLKCRRQLLESQSNIVDEVE